MQRHVSDDEITTAMTTGITFKGAKLRKPQEEKVKTKAKKKKYITGLHGSGAAKKKAEIRQRRANRHKKGVLTDPQILLVHTRQQCVHTA